MPCASPLSTGADMISNAISDEKVRPAIKDLSRSVSGVAGGVCIALGIILMIGGLMLWIVGYLESLKIDGVEMLTLAAAIFLLAAGSHCLDISEAAERQ